MSSSLVKLIGYDENKQREEHVFVKDRQLLVKDQEVATTLLSLATNGIPNGSTSANQDLIKTEINNLNLKTTKLLKKSPHFYRERGECFQMCVRDLEMTTTDSDIISFLNPSGSGKTIFIYNINLSIFCKTHLTQKHYAELSMRKVNQANISGGTDLNNFNRGNLNFSISNKGAAVIKNSPTIDNALGTVEEIHLNDEGNGQHLDYQEEFLEIPEGFGFVYTGHANDENVELAINIRYIETDLE